MTPRYSNATEAANFASSRWPVRSTSSISTPNRPFSSSTLGRERVPQVHQHLEIREWMPDVTHDVRLGTGRRLLAPRTFLRWCEHESFHLEK